MDILNREAPRADQRIAYGRDVSQFGDLWLPRGGPRAAHGWPVVVFVHGGWWSSAYDLAYGGFLCRALREAGVAVWSLEYRRTGATGGGWPTTFQDVAAGLDFLPTFAERARLDLRRVVAAGHSAGGHLAFWLAGRVHVPPSAVVREPQPRVALRGVVALAGAVDLALLEELSVGRFSTDRTWVEHLMGGSPEKVPERYAAGDPGRLLPLVCPQVLVQGTEDSQIPPQLPERWAAKSRKSGSACSVHVVPGATHFDVVDPESRAWTEVRSAILGLL